ncbi:uncharacterized protein LOC129581831 [Paramacrobiotus metropolitanus]|uniref:uncharacterized protein LOC129581831 n=1 Tax=Paramacrobiotus metropolitanus TaxID=2943436 RepID=UPI00244585C4|nr:uncharacterized protein LOC129581831 [Paramacrobiotus metropolitanus]
MASFLCRRVLAQCLQQRVHLRRPLRATITPCIRFIATTEKKKDAAVGGLALPDDCSVTKPGGGVDTNYEQRKDWYTRGMDYDDEDIDRWQWNIIMFVVVTCFTIGTTWFMMYAPVRFPDTDWVCREAFLELHRREKFGLPLVDPDLVPRENIILPSDEELGDFAITI